MKIQNSSTSCKKNVLIVCCKDRFCHSNTRSICSNINCRSTVNIQQSSINGYGNGPGHISNLWWLRCVKISVVWWRSNFIRQDFVGTCFLGNAESRLVVYRWNCCGISCISWINGKINCISWNNGKINNCSCDLVWRSCERRSWLWFLLIWFLFIVCYRRF